jgi:chromate transporter
MDTVMTPSKATPFTRKEMFLCFLYVGLISFGGVLPWARRELVDQRKWLTSDEFAEMLSLGQILPGPNVVNLSIMFGARHYGPLGSLLAASGLMLAPLVILLVLANLYGTFSHYDAVQHAVRATASVSAGLMLAVGINMLSKMRKALGDRLVTLAAFTGSGLLTPPLLLVLAVTIPVSIVFSWWSRK